MNVPDLQELLQATATGLLVGGLFSLTALGLSLVLGVMRLVNLVHGELVIIGSYLSYVLLARFGLDPLMALPLVAVLAGGLAYPIQRVLLQPLARRGEETAMLTSFALSVIVQNLLILWLTGDTRSVDRSYTRATLDLGPVTVPAIYLIAFAIAVAVSAAAHLLVTRTAFGRRLRAGSEDAEAAAVVGVHVPRLHARTYALAGAIAGLSGALAGMAFAFTPTSGGEYLLTGFAVVVLGGLGSVVGTAVGGLVLGIAEACGALLFGDGYRLLVGLTVFLVFLAIRPRGLCGRAVA